MAMFKDFGDRGDREVAIGLLLWLLYIIITVSLDNISVMMGLKLAQTCMHLYFVKLETLLKPFSPFDGETSLFCTNTLKKTATSLFFSDISEILIYKFTLFF